MIDEDKLVN